MSHLQFYHAILSRNFIARQNGNMQLCLLQLQQTAKTNMASAAFLLLQPSFTNWAHKLWNCFQICLFFELID